MSTNFGTDGDRGKDVVGLDVDLVVGKGAEWGDEMWGGGI